VVPGDFFVVVLGGSFLFLLVVTAMLWVLDWLVGLVRDALGSL
jgi:hypothetical protein